MTGDLLTSEKEVCARSDRGQNTCKGWLTWCILLTMVVGTEAWGGWEVHGNCACAKGGQALAPPPGEL
jgi:hypothetical protein